MAAVGRQIILREPQSVNYLTFRAAGRLKFRREKFIPFGPSYSYGSGGPQHSNQLPPWDATTLVSPSKHFTTLLANCDTDPISLSTQMPTGHLVWQSCVGSASVSRARAAVDAPGAEQRRPLPSPTGAAGIGPPGWRHSGRMSVPAGSSARSPGPRAGRYTPPSPTMERNWLPPKLHAGSRERAPTTTNSAVTDPSGRRLGACSSITSSWSRAPRAWTPGSRRRGVIPSPSGQEVRFFPTVLPGRSGSTLRVKFHTFWCFFDRTSQHPGDQEVRSKTRSKLLYL